MAKLLNKQIDSFPLLGLNSKKYETIDLSIDGEISKKQSGEWYAHLQKLPLNNPSTIFFGGYLEERFFYSNETLFGKNEDQRNIHIGVDLWEKAGANIFCPFDGIVHSMKNNNKELDYGYTIILQHVCEDLIFYTLYGHLSNQHVSSLSVNDKVSKGETFCEIGPQKQNGNWPPHLHFQVILDLGKFVGDYPGVCHTNEVAFYKKNCPDGTSFIF